MANKTIKLTQLFINPENYRFEPVTSQKESIDVMVSDQEDKLYNLASDILEIGLSPVDLIQVTPIDDKKYLVLEGNRRITSLKLLNNPSLISDKYINLRKKFIKLKKDNYSKIIKSVNCVIFDNPSDANIWIKRKHANGLNGIGTVTWNSQQKQRFDEKIEGKSSLPLQVITLLKSHEAVPQELKENLPNLNTTNLQRLISDPYVREQLALEINNGKLVSNVENSEVIKGLINIVTDILSPTFTVKKIYDREKRKNYIDEFQAIQKPDLSKEADNTWELQNYNYNESKSITLKNKNDIVDKKTPITPIGRKTLIPKKCVIKIDILKINRIYNELKNILVQTCPNACGILFRVFLELSVDAYLEYHNLVQREALTASASKEALQSKVNKTINHLYLNKQINEDISKGIKAEINDANSVLSINSLNAYVHNTDFCPKPDNLILGWDNIERFMVILWNNING